MRECEEEDEEKTLKPARSPIVWGRPGQTNTSQQTKMAGKQGSSVGSSEDATHALKRTKDRETSDLLLNNLQSLTKRKMAQTRITTG